MEQFVNFIIRPPRADYNPKEDLLDQEFMLKGRWYQRKDLEVINSRGNVLQCTHYVPLMIPEGKALPCVIYCHGNSGCRADASEAAIILLPSNITLFALDFSGSGLSEGEHVTLGWNEKDDLRAVVNYLRTDGNVSCIGLWGRSMGAVTSLMYGAEDPSIAGMVLDSPFSNLVDLMMEHVDTSKYPLPKFTVKYAIRYLQRVIRKKANFNIMDLDTVQVAKCCFVPVLFGHATGDDFIRPHHSDRIYECYVGDKNIIKFDGDHNSPRLQFYFDSITIFFHNVLNPPCDEQYFHAMRDFSDKDHWAGVNEIEHGHHSFVGSSKELGSGSTEDAISQLCSSGRPMSRMEDHWAGVNEIEHGHHSFVGSSKELGSGSTEDAISQLCSSGRPMSRMEVPSDISSQEKPNGPEEDGTDGRSSSWPFSAVLANGRSHSQADDEYLEYSFDDFSDVPSSMEDEERMLMEAIIESFKDMELSHSQQDVQSNVDTSPNDPSSDSTIASMPEPNGTILPSSERKSTGRPVPDSVGSGVATESSSANGYTSSRDTCNRTRGSEEQEIDTADGPRTRLVAENIPSSHVVKGLAHRWGLNFFRSNR